MKHKSKARRDARKTKTFREAQAHADRVLKKLQARIPDISKPAPERAWDIDAVVIATEIRECRICHTMFDCPPRAPMLKLSRPNAKHPDGARESRISRMPKSEVLSVLVAGYAVEHEVVKTFVECCHLCTPQREAQLSASPGIPRQLLGDTLLSGEEVEARTQTRKPKAPVPSLEDF